MIKTIAVPNRPVLADGVQLIGEFASGAFRNQQWLIEQNGHFIQVPELLYRIAQYANGERTLDEIASLITASTDWIATPEQVGTIIAAKLLPLMIVAPAVGAPAAPAVTRPLAGPLQLRLPTKVLGPRVIDPAANVFRFLHAPAVMIPLLIGAAAAHAWFYLVHGMVASIRDVAYVPGALAAVLGLLILGGVFHEFGHASALRYAGGRARSIGVGIYLIYPAFYTDTTDSYRLGRWARVRTDLGGFYFHAIFTLALFASYALSGQEWLLVTVLFIDAGIARQLLPFVRFDGYWALTDLLGIPDILSQMKQRLRSVVQPELRAALASRKQPELKPWAQRIFIAYTVVTAPILGLLLVVLLIRAPLAFSALWTALLTGQDKVVTALGHQTIGAAAAAGTQVALLAIQVVGITYLLYLVLGRAFRGLWRWGKPSRRRRLASLAVGAFAMVLLATYWNSSLGLTFGGIAGVQTCPVSARNHVLTPVSYPQVPPVGGPHFPIWQNCGFYPSPVPKEAAVHSMEHGAVWITYRTGLPAGEVAALRVLAIRESYVLVSPYPDLPAPIVASAWGRQLRLDSSADPRLDQFVREFRLGQQAPEHGRTCSGGLGTPTS